MMKQYKPIFQVLWLWWALLDSSPAFAKPPTHGILSQSTSDPAPGVDFYDNEQEKAFEAHGRGTENPANHRGNYNQKDGQVRINAGRIRLDDGGGELAQVTYTEKERRRQHQEGVDSKASAAQRQHQAYFLGKLGASPSSGPAGPQWQAPPTEPG